MMFFKVIFLLNFFIWNHLSILCPGFNGGGLVLHVLAINGHHRSAKSIGYGVISVDHLVELVPQVQLGPPAPPSLLSSQVLISHILRFP